MTFLVSKFCFKKLLVATPLPWVSFDVNVAITYIYEGGRETGSVLQMN